MSQQNMILSSILRKVKHKVMPSTFQPFGFHFFKAKKQLNLAACQTPMPQQ
jgi:hypothetical protein